MEFNSLSDMSNSSWGWGRCSVPLSRQSTCPGDGGWCLALLHWSPVRLAVVSQLLGEPLQLQAQSPERPLMPLEPASVLHNSFPFLLTP